MKIIILIGLSALVVATSAGKLDDVLHTPIEQILADETQRKQFIGCLIDEQLCGKYQMFREIVPALIATSCGRCTPEQKKRFDEVDKFVKAQ